MARAPKKAAKKTNSTGLLAALQFVSVAQKDVVGLPLHTHCSIFSNYVVASDGIIAAGHKVEEDLTAKPHTLNLIESLKLCKTDLSITQFESKLLVKSGKFENQVPCYTDEIALAYPDPACCSIDDRIKRAFNNIGFLVNEKAQQLPLATALLTSGSMFTTNGRVILQYWHGNDLPPHLVLPKAFIDAVCKTNKTLAKFGYSLDSVGNFNSITFYFDDESRIKTQLYADKWPLQIVQFLDVPTNCIELPPLFYDGVEAVAKFSKTGSIFLKKDCVRSSYDESQGASFEVPGLPEGAIFAYEYLKMIKDFVKTVDFTSYKDKLLFFGENIRGAVAAKVA